MKHVKGIKCKVGEETDPTEQEPPPPPPPPEGD